MANLLEMLLFASSKSSLPTLLYSSSVYNPAAPSSQRHGQRLRPSRVSAACACRDPSCRAASRRIRLYTLALYNGPRAIRLGCQRPRFGCLWFWLALGCCDGLPDQTLLEDSLESIIYPCNHLNQRPDDQVSLKRRRRPLALRQPRPMPRKTPQKQEATQGRCPRWPEYGQVPAMRRKEPVRGLPQLQG